MNHYSELPIWPRAYADTNANGMLKTHNEDFVVTELSAYLPSGEGEHVWLDVEKNGSNTAFVAAKIAELAGVRDMDVGYAGMKDRYALTRQWFSVYLPKTEAPDFAQLNNEEFTILSQSRHVKKLRRGDLLGNHFVICLRDVQGDKDLIENNLAAIKEWGVPNYFGAQRFGRDGDNVEQGRAMLAREIRVRNAKRKGIYLSAVRSFLFNEVLAKRIGQGDWGKTYSGDLLDDHQLPTGPLWGRGKLAVTDAALEFEMEIASQHPELCDGLEHAGLSQERRSLSCRPEQFQWQWRSESELVLTFSLPGGYYATSLIREIMHTEEPQRETEHDPAAV